MRKNWENMILTMADGDIIKANEIKEMDAKRDFWQFMDYWKTKQKEKINSIRQRRKQ